MNLFRASILVFLVAASGGRAANSSIAPIDVTQRNAEFAPAATITPDRRSPQVDHEIQDRRVDKKLLPKPVGGEMPRAGMEVAESRTKPLLDAPRDSLAPLPANLNPAAHRATSIPDNVKQPPRVSRYQDGLAAARAANLARFPELKPGASPAKLNRFIFRKNVPEPALVTPVTGPAAGGASGAK